eukprot:Nk52_evm12s165 gene=Nk52_evmTU12s165
MGSKDKPVSINMSAIDSEHITNLKISWSNISFSVPCENESMTDSKPVLNNVSGSLTNGRLAALMGLSGSGKTSLLNTLSGRVVHGDVTGSLYVNDQQVNMNTCRKMVAYVPQNEVFLTFLTVRETIMYAAKLKLDSAMTDEQREKRVDQVIDELWLNDCKNTIIGDQYVKGISGGEKRRVAIAIEILHNPQVLFLDEPTSGLDSETAETVVQVLKNISLKGRIVLITIHQPKYDVFTLFDDLFLLSQGQMVYKGIANKSMEYFSELGYPIPQYENPCDHYMKIIKQCEQRKDPQEALYSPELRGLNPLKYQCEQNEGLIADTADVPLDVAHRIGRVKQFQVLFGRSFFTFLRDIPTHIGMFSNYILLAVLIGMIFYQLNDDYDTLREKAGAIFAIIVPPTFSIVLSTINFIMAMKNVFIRERSSNSYKVLPWFMAQSLADIPLLTIWIIVSGIIQYYMIGFRNDAASLFTFLLFFWASQIAAYSFGVFLAAISPNPFIAFIFAPVLNIVLMMVGGYYVNLSSMPVWIGDWLPYLSYLYYAFVAIAVDQFHGQEYSCGVNCVKNGDDFLNSLGIGPETNIWAYFGYIMILAVGWRVLAYFVILYGPTKPRTSFRNELQSGTK